MCIVSVDNRAYESIGVALLALREMSHAEIVSLLDCRRHPFLMLKSYCQATREGPDCECRRGTHWRAALPHSRIVFACRHPLGT